MDNTLKNWLVRTRTGEILGPYSERDLFEELKKRTFTAEDEIAPSQGQWISAQTLANREADEFTHTHTRNDTITSSISTGTHSAWRTTRDELTPTPEIIPRHVQEVVERKETALPKAPSPNTHSTASRVGSFVGIVCIAGGFWMLVSGLTPHKHRRHIGQVSGMGDADTAGESPFLRQINEMIRAGDREAALKELQAFHEKPSSKGDLEHLIPYAALLITQDDAPARARGLLEPVLSSAQASPQLKAQAHHWLGYLALAQDQGDRGESHFLDCLQLNPKDAAARFNLGRAYLKQEKFSQALDNLQVAELEAPDLWLIHLYKAQAKALLGNTEEARASFKMAIEASPDRWNSYIYYALFLAGIHEPDAARMAMKKMLTRDPEYELQSPAPWRFYQEKVNRAEYYEPFSTVMEKSAGEEKELGKLYLRYLAHGSANDGRKIEALGEKGGLMARVLALKMALDREASNAEIRAALARLPDRLSDFGAYAYVLRADAKARLALFNDAQSDFHQALTIEPRSAVAHWAYAVFLKKSQRGEDAETEIRNLLSYHPDYIPAIVSAHHY